MAIFAPLPEIKPYKTAHWDKKAEVEIMFDKISGKYDLLNRLLSLGIDNRWRKKALLSLLPFQPKVILDLATGTGDMAFMADKLLKPKVIKGVDLSAGMLEIARKRLSAKASNIHSTIEFTKGEAEKLDFPDNTFDAVTVAFGVRNYADLHQGLREMNRVL